MTSQPRELKLRDGSRIPLPLLVPSFSSKGFPTFTREGNEISDVFRPFETTHQVLDESFLVSAYDLHHGFMPLRSSDLTASAVFLDSGGYELSPFFDSIEPMFHPYPKRAFSAEEYTAVLESMDSTLPLVIASPDWETRDKSLEEQLVLAQEFLQPYEFTKSVILKPGGRKYVRIDDLAPIVGRLGAFDVVGITEKELGKTLKDRLRAVARLRELLDRNGLEAVPIHVWGGLDPVITPLYFFAGAEIFDGLSWLRYAFYKGSAIYRDAKQILEGHLGNPFEHCRAQVWFENLSELRRLTGSLKIFASSGGGEFGGFEWNGEAFQKGFEMLCAEIPEIRRRYGR